MVNGTDIAKLQGGELEEWRRSHIGVIAHNHAWDTNLTLLDNVILRMDAGRLPTTEARRDRALALLEQVHMAQYAHQMPTLLAEGHRQLAAIAVALANDPPIIIADEPSALLNASQTEAILQLFEGLVRQGKTVIMATSDSTMAKWVQRSVVISGGEIVNPHVLRALPSLDLEMVEQLQHCLHRQTYKPGEIVIREGEEGDTAYIITKGAAEVIAKRPDGQNIHIATLQEGQYFGEIALVRGGPRTATVRAAGNSPMELLALGREALNGLLSGSNLTRAEMEEVIRRRLSELKQMGSAVSTLTEKV